jgi:hypothetical protein
MANQPDPRKQKLCLHLWKDVVDAYKRRSRIEKTNPTALYRKAIESYITRIDASLSDRIKTLEHSPSPKKARRET